MDEQERSGTGRTAPPRPRGRAARWGGGVAVAALLVGGGAAAVAATGHHEHHGGHAAARGGQRDGAEHGREQRGEQRGERHDRGELGGDGSRSGQRSGGRPTRRAAPAPLPSLDAADALVKAASAVPGGRAESIRTATAADGSRAWQAVVLGPDGTRHLVTVDGTTGALTGNTPLTG
ncbi:hypothetical protein [Kitasatospora cineracea]|uniref:Peptidase YpeB-like protein n=1 Tax=Kitasatospora cineracea TaxID=88074 RepID=A0A8G1XEJ7_9ACTN|nr:hypothetical protein [Kitasatospora cineracea]ROR46248.1 hypothetical protein EDD39_4508 [Kitasatospora cineracea]